jgi:hypothetical protein
LRAFIVGNGPSLAKTDMDLLQAYPSFACNRIELIYSKTQWRPTFYVRMEGYDMLPVPKEKYLPSIRYHEEHGIQCHISRYFQDEIGEHSNVHYLRACSHHEYNYDDPKTQDEWHLPELCAFGGSVNMSLQLACTMGFDDLVLVGCDLGYKDHTPSHFSPEYEHGFEQPAWYANRNTFWGYVCAINWLKRNKPNVRIRNATVGGYLELFPRVRLEKVATRVAPGKWAESPVYAD